MKRSLSLLLLACPLTLAVAAFPGCGGDVNSGGIQISEKAGPDPELAPTKPAKGKAGHRNAQR